MAKYSLTVKPQWPHMLDENIHSAKLLSII